MRRIALAVAGLFVLLGTTINYSNKRELRKTDSYIRDRVIMLTGNSIECSAIEVKSPSGKVYTLSAAHCQELLKNGYADAHMEDGSVKLIKMLEIDNTHDLMLLEAADNKSIDIAKKSHKYQKVHTITHGHGMPSYRTDGELLEEQEIAITESVWSEEDMIKCQNLGRQLVMSMDGIGCMFKLNLMMSTAQVIPGSSGGAVLNSDGQLVGIVSATDGYFSAFVPLIDIHNFLMDK